MTFSFFLSIYSRCGAPASWAARHTTVCLDIYHLICLLMDSSLSRVFICDVVAVVDLEIFRGGFRFHLTSA